MNFFTDAGEISSDAASQAQKITDEAGNATDHADSAIETIEHNPLGVITASALGSVEEEEKDAKMTDSEFQQAEQRASAALAKRVRRVFLRAAAYGA